MNYELMHKNIVVAEVEIETKRGGFVGINKVYNEKHLPLPLKQNNATDKETAFDKWWHDRSIPSSRQQSRDILAPFAGIPSYLWLLLKCNAASLSDQYWVREVEETKNWDNTNFFTNNFSDDVGKFLFGEIRYSETLDLNSPSNTVNGNLSKKWIIEDGKRILIKGASDIYQQEPINEVISGLIMKRLSIKHISYDSYIIGQGSNIRVLCKCENFITTNTELVPAWHIFINDNLYTPNYEYFIRAAESYGITNIRTKMEELLCLDYIVGNTDRHLNNFGLVRDADTLDFLNFAPIYDTGMSLFSNVGTNIIDKMEDIKARPFYDYQSEQIKLVKNTNLDFSKIKAIDNDIYDIMSKSPLLSEQRKEKLISVLNYRINSLEKILDKQINKKYNTSIIDDINQNAPPKRKRR